MEVDDDPCIQRMIRRLPDLIILDLSKSMIDGFEVASHLKSNPETREIPIILTTDLDSSQNHIRALDAGANDFFETDEPEEILWCQYYEKLQSI